MTASGRSRPGAGAGVEIDIQRRTGAVARWWLSYALARAEDEIDGVLAAAELGPAPRRDASGST